MLFTPATDRLQAKLGEAIATAESDFLVWWFDSAAAPGANRAANKSNGVATVFLCNAPPAATLRQIKGVTFKNRDSVGHSVTFFYFDGATSWEISPALIVGVGGGVEWTNERGWQVLSG